MDQHRVGITASCHRPAVLGSAPAAPPSAAPRQLQGSASGAAGWSCVLCCGADLDCVQNRATVEAVCAW